MRWEWMDGTFGPIALIVFVLWVVFAVLVILALAGAVRWLFGQGGGRPGAGPGGTGPGAEPPPVRPDDPLEILRQRYARGEIDEEEYERRRRTLTGS